MRIEYKWEDKLDKGDRGLFGTWGNFFCDRGTYEVAGIIEQTSKNLELLKPFTENPDVSEKCKEAIKKYKETGELDMGLCMIEDLYLTPEEYYEYLGHTDCQSPFIYKGEGTVALGHYYRS